MFPLQFRHPLQAPLGPLHGREPALHGLLGPLALGQIERRAIR